MSRDTRSNTKAIQVVEIGGYQYGRALAEAKQYDDRNRLPGRLPGRSQIPPLTHCMNKRFTANTASCLGTDIGSANAVRARGAAQQDKRLIQHRLPDAASELRALHAGLLAPQARIASKYFYDATGCGLFADICRLPEYYVTRTEAAIFASHQRQIAIHLPKNVQWLDVGCGDGLKSHPWLKATAARRFIGVDVAQESLLHAIEDAARSFLDLECLGVVADLSLPFELQPILAERTEWPAVFFYPGSSLGNFSPEGAVSLLSTIRAHLNDRGALLIGVDLVKEPEFLEAAYNDKQGVTAAFNRNILHVVNRLTDADFDPDKFAHSAHFAADAGRIEMRLVAREPMSVHIGQEVRHFEIGEAILTEYSHKYTVEGFVTMLDRAGYGRQHIWTDERGWFGVFLAQP